MAEKDSTAPWILKMDKRLSVITAILVIIGSLYAASAFFSANAAGVQEVKAEQARMTLEIAEIKADNALEMAKLETQLESALSDMNPVLLDMQSRMVRLETKVDMVLSGQAEP